MAAPNYHVGGANTGIHFAIGECTLGSILVAKSARGVCTISLGDNPELLAHELQNQFPNANLIGTDDGVAQLTAKIVGFIEVFDLPLDIQGTRFQQRVWQAL